MTVRFFASLALALLASSIASAEPANSAKNPELFATANGVRDAAHAAALGLRRFDVTVEIRGGVAETTVDAAFSNTTAQQLEGDFRLAMPQGAVISGYQLDIGGQMVDGVLVDRPRAKAVYEARVRRGVDPGLAEAMPDGAFQTHVFPIWPGRGRMIRVHFVTPAGGYRLPLAIDAPAEGWSIAVHVSGVASAPVLTGPDGHKLSFEKSGDGYDAKREGKRALQGDLKIEDVAPLDLVVSTHRSGERNIELGGEFPSLATGRKLEQRLRIYWDRSRSRRDGDLDREIALVGRLVGATHPAIVELVSFNSSGAERKIASSADDAVAWLKGLHYRGATSFAALAKEEAFAKETAADHCILFSDGKPTIDLGVSFTPPCVLDTVSSSPNADAAWLRHLANGRGGQAFALRGGNEADIAAGLAADAAHVFAVMDRDGRNLPFVPLKAATGRWRLLARAPEGGDITVRFLGGGVMGSVTRSSNAPDEPFDGAGALIAADMLATLGGTSQRAEYVALSRRYGIASPSLSFVVLETPFDYLAANIEPPASYPAETRDAFLRQRKQMDADKTVRQDAWLEQLARNWQSQVVWWNTKFDPAAKPKKIQTSTHFDRPATVGAVTAPPPLPSPPPASAPRLPRSRAAIETVTVTSNKLAADVQSVPIAVTAVSEKQAGSSTVAGAPAVKSQVALSPTIRIDAWQPDRPYLELYDGKPSEFDERFLEAEQRHGTLPIFYLDTAEWLRKHGHMAEAIEMALSALELPSANDVTLGIVADRLERYGAIDRAIELRERQMTLDPDRPQPKRLLALALAHRATLEPAYAQADLTRAINLLYEIATTPQDGSWFGVELIALDEANALLPRLNKLGGSVKMDQRLVALLDVDIRVVIDWTTDASDMDLWVDEPDGERAIYNNRRTAIGGNLSNDMTQGYGPEEYMLHHAPDGTYVVQANVYAPDRLDPNGATFVTAHLFRNYGRANQQEDSVDMELKRDESGSKLIGRIVLPDAAEADKKVPKSKNRGQ